MYNLTSCRMCRHCSCNIKLSNIYAWLVIYDLVGKLFTNDLWSVICILWTLIGLKDWVSYGLNHWIRGRVFMRVRSEIGSHSRWTQDVHYDLLGTEGCCIIVRDLWMWDKKRWNNYSYFVMICMSLVVLFLSAIEDL